MNHDTVLTLEPNWSTFVPGDSVTFTCDMKEGENTDWEIRFIKDGRDYYHYGSGLTLNPLVTGDSGKYQCAGHHKINSHSKTSKPIYLTVSAEPPKARLTAGPSTISVGDSVRLSCSVDGSDGWKYEWFRQTSNTYVTPAADGDNREIRVSQGGVYACVGRRGEPAFDTQYSEYVTIKITYSNYVSVSLQLDWTQVIRGQITVRCEIQGGGDTQWVYDWETTSGQTITQRTYTNYWTVSAFSSGGYRCRGTNRQDSDSSTRWSEAAALTVSGAVLTFDPIRSRYFTGESVTFTCDMKDDKRTEWETRLIKDGEEIASYSGYRIKALSTEDSGRYQCFRVHRKTNHIKNSGTIELIVSDKPRASLTSDNTVIAAGGSVKLSCSVDGSDGWKYDWFRSAALIRTNTESNSIRITDGGNYYCRGGRGNPVYYTQNSVSVTVEERVSNKAAVKRQHDWPEIFKGEEITLTCEIQAGGDTEWEYEWTQGNVRRTADGRKLWVFTASGSSSGDYKCRGRQKTNSYSSTAWSDPLRLTVTASKPKAELRSDETDIPVGGSVTLGCSVTSSSGWKYYWYRDKSSEVLITQDGETSVSQEGLYWCRGGRGNPVYYTQYSDSVRINKNVPNKVVVTLHPNWTQLFSGETITVRCEIEDRGDTEWEYEWKTPRTTNTQQNEVNITSASSSHSGNYSCRGRMRNAQHDTTEWSQSIRLTVSYNKAQCVLTASPSWLSPGASVALSCEVEPPSAGWRFYWYQTVPDGSHSSYRYELLPGSEHGTEQGSYMLDGHTHTAGYVCRAARGEPVYYTDYSKAAFVWSGDVDPSASLTVSPDIVQHFTRDSVSLSCEGNSTEWRVRRFPEGGFLSSCSYWTTSGSRCDIITSQSGSAVFWCESGSGHFSNSVNITVHGPGLILMSPVRPVTEGLSVSLSCKLKTGQKPSSVFFYHNEQLIQNDSRVELNISAVSKSHEGFYKCWSQGRESPQSWMAVNASKSSNGHIPVMLVVGLVCGVGLLLLLLLLLCRFRRSKGSCYIRPTHSGTVWTSNTTPSVSQNQNQPETGIYESVNDSENTGKDVSDVTYSVIELKSFEQNRRQHKPAESPVYSDLKIRPADDALLYVQVKHKDKRKRVKGKPCAAATDELLYSQVKPGTSFSSNAAM
ncbi:titin-like isoform X2 [Betta splendens]|uniref:Titin-like isoform X2 n=1 Tax=Betta splendens TaxID=158456 RepID=A0A9W2XMG5_BETSP|nr:titin-like isoform X2 [Betta splendens]